MSEVAGMSELERKLIEVTMALSRVRALLETPEDVLWVAQMATKVTDFRQKKADEAG
jgi:ABC-type uncharacterized transport system ATPase subunit